LIHRRQYSIICKITSLTEKMFRLTYRLRMMKHIADGAN